MIGQIPNQHWQRLSSQTASGLFPDGKGQNVPGSKAASNCKGRLATSAKRAPGSIVWTATFHLWLQATISLPARLGLSWADVLSGIYWWIMDLQDRKAKQRQAWEDATIWIYNIYLHIYKDIHIYKYKIHIYKYIVHIYKYIIHIHKHIYIYKYLIHIYIYTYILTYIQIYTYIYTNI